MPSSSAIADPPTVPTAPLAAPLAAPATKLLTKHTEEKQYPADEENPEAKRVTKYTEETKRVTKHNDKTNTQANRLERI